MVRIELTADDSLAAIRARSRLGMAIAAIIRMIATTISNSISEKPFCFRISLVPLSDSKFGLQQTQLGNVFAFGRPLPGADHPRSLWLACLLFSVFRQSLVIR